MHMYINTCVYMHRYITHINAYIHVYIYIYIEREIPTNTQHTISTRHLALGSTTSSCYRLASPM